MQVIIISGQARCGKTTLANIMAEEGFNKGYVPVLESFAGPIKEAALAEGLDKENNKEEYRLFCQEYGASRRTEDDKHFITMAAERLAQYSKDEAEDIEAGKKYWERLVIFDDGRYPNELRFGKACDGFLMFVSRPDLPDPYGDWRDHESEYLSRVVESSGFESHFDDVFDVYLINDSGNVEEMRQGVRRNLREWLNDARSPFLSAHDHSDCACPICTASREDRIPDASEILEYILFRLTGEGLNQEQLREIEEDLENGLPPHIDIDIRMNFNTEEDEDGDSPDNLG